MLRGRRDSMKKRQGNMGGNVIGFGISGMPKTPTANSCPFNPPMLPVSMPGRMICRQSPIWGESRLAVVLLTCLQVRHFLTQ